ncbi:hypothetical protein BT96DRAFT_990278 [Gymnopus androsaceus JB14]|uniref:Uncharacterized protein n=1 Tax=Gymnopus androsaceus JB14 TaxID=1447944 RepID=A0A6A4HXZ2_9AGAR|nr:hypothetical protein BT96DRAFT_990278 [Gymnopus androsaceus JB14]
MWYFQAEKSTIALHKHHPELKSVWGDLEANIKVVKPAESQQPANIKLTLLPFQRESLHWMKKQEEGVWKGAFFGHSPGSDEQDSAGEREQGIQCEW